MKYRLPKAPTQFTHTPSVCGLLFGSVVLAISGFTMAEAKLKILYNALSDQTEARLGQLAGSR